MVEARAPTESKASTANPFGVASDEFFGEADRARQLDELRHPARWSRRLLAVTGERGVGKSTLYRALSGRLDPGVKAARINANLTSDMREVLSGIVHGFGLAGPGNADPQLLIALILLHVREQIDANRYCLVLIDDAHLLELRALEQLLRLTDANADEGLRIVFFAEPHFVQSLDKAARRGSQLQTWHEIRLAPFTEEEARRYVAFRLAQAGVEQSGTHSSDSPSGRSTSSRSDRFTPNQLAVVVGGSGGLPGRIDELANAILTGELTINDERGWLPRVHRAVVVLVLIAAGMGWLIFSNHQSDRTAVAEQIAKGAEQPDTPPALAGAPASLVGAAEPLVGAAEPLVLPPIDETRSVGTIERQASVTRRDIAAPAPANAPAPIVDDTPVPPEPAAPVVASRSAPAASFGPQSAQWLRRQPGDHFTLQLLATTSRAKRDQFVRRQARPERFATFETRRNNAAWYAVTYGNYATRAEATAAAAALPSSVGRVEPWIRTFASVQAALD